jgi:hypothetical protein
MINATRRPQPTAVLAKRLQRAAKRLRHQGQDNVSERAVVRTGEPA